MISKPRTAGRPNRAAEVAEMLAKAICMEKIPHSDRDREIVFPEQFHCQIILAASPHS